MTEYHMIQKRDLVQMLAPMPDDAKVIVEVGHAAKCKEWESDIRGYIDKATCNNRVITIRCHDQET